MRKSRFNRIALVLFVLLGLVGAPPAASQAEKAPFPTMAPVDEYLFTHENSEIALPRLGFRGVNAVAPLGDRYVCSL